MKKPKENNYNDRKTPSAARGMWLYYFDSVKTYKMKMYKELLSLLHNELNL